MSDKTILDQPGWLRNSVWARAREWLDWALQKDQYPVDRWPVGRLAWTRTLSEHPKDWEWPCACSECEALEGSVPTDDTTSATGPVTAPAGRAPR